MPPIREYIFEINEDAKINITIMSYSYEGAVGKLLKVVKKGINYKLIN